MWINFYIKLSYNEITFKSRNKKNRGTSFTIGFICNLFAQDLIVKKDGTEIPSKIIEIGIDNVKFKKFDNLLGPDYILPKYEIVFVKFENGTKEVFSIDNPSDKCSETFIRKGPHLGFHFTPGYGKLMENDIAAGNNFGETIDTKMKYNFTFNFGLDLSIYFNDYVGIKT